MIFILLYILGVMYDKMVASHYCHCFCRLVAYHVSVSESNYIKVTLSGQSVIRFD